MNEEPSTGTHPIVFPRWSAPRLLAVARARVFANSNDVSPPQGDMRLMLACLLQEAGWTDDQFLEALVSDVGRS